MYTLDSYKIRIEADLNPGFYILQNKSAEGKTYLANILYKYMGYGEPVGSYTYANFLAHDLLSIRFSEKVKLFIFDRLDMYYSLLNQNDIDLIKEMSKTSVILADLKGGIDSRGPSPKRALITMGDQFIRIRSR